VKSLASILATAEKKKTATASVAGCLATASERLTLNRAGQVVLTLKTPYRDCTTHVVMSPLEFMQGLPRPRLYLIRFHGVLAPNAKLHAEIIPGTPVNAKASSSDHGDVPQHSAPARMSWARLLTKPPGAVLNGACRPEGRKPGRAFVNGCSISILSTALTAATGAYSYQEIATHFGIHFTTVGQIVRSGE
jgi:hypothetical protein